MMPSADCLAPSSRAPLPGPSSSSRAARLRRAAPLACAALLAGCVPDIDDDSSIVSAARVLAIVADPPEAGEGASVSLSALVASDADASDPVSYFFCRQRKPLSELGPVDPRCLGGGEALVALGSGSSVSASIERGVCSVFGPRRPSAEPGQPAGRAADPDATGGFYQPVMAELPGQLPVLGGVRLDCGLPTADRADVIEYNQRHRINQNPRVDRLEALRGEAWTELADGGDALRVGAGERLALRADWAECASDERCTGAETYVLYDTAAQALVERTESLIATWYATAGELDEARTEASSAPFRTENGWTAPAEAGAVRLWVVLRDGRGGVGFGAYRLQVE